MDALDIFSEIVNWAVLIFILTRTIGTVCFGKTDWILTIIALSFSYFIRYVKLINKKIQGDTHEEK